MSFTGNNPNFQTLRVLSPTAPEGLTVLPNDKFVGIETIIATVGDIVFAGSGSNTLVALPNGLNVDGTVNYTLTILRASFGTSLTMTSLSGTPFQVGELVTGQSSGSSAILFYIDNTSLTLFCDSASGAFIPGETIVGSLSGASEVLNAEAGPYDTFDWKDDQGNSGTDLVCPVQHPLSFGVEVQFQNFEGCTPGDTFTFPVTGQVKPTFVSSGSSRFVGIGEIYLDSQPGVALVVDFKQEAVISAAFKSVFTPPVFTGSGLDDLTPNTNNVGSLPSNVTYTVTIDGAGPPDSFSWNDDQGNSDTGVLIGPSPPGNTLSFGTVIGFNSDTGHTPGDSWTFTVQQGVLALMNLNYYNLRAAIGDIFGVLNGTSIEVNVPNETIDVTGALYVPNGVRSDGYNNLSGALVVDANARTLNTSAGIVSVDFEKGRYCDPKGGLALLAPAAGTRQLIGPTGAVIAEVQTSQFNVPGACRVVGSLELVAGNKPVSQVRTSSAAISVINQSIQYINATSGNVTLTLPTAAAGTRYLTFKIKRVDNSGNTAEVSAAGGQLIDDSATPVSLAYNEAIEVQCELFGGVYQWKVIGGYTP